jgi:phosphate transport system substrate-binding protein
MTRQRLLMVLVILVVIAGCASRGEVVMPEEPQPAMAEAVAIAAEAFPDEPPPYVTVAGLSGKITSIGASTTTNLVARAAAEFRRIYPAVTLEVTAGLTSIGPPALLEGKTDIVPMSRPLTPEEVGAFTKKYGYPPTEIKVAADALAIYVEKRNPLPGLTLGQLGAIFSRLPRADGSWILTWDQVGLSGEWAARPISLYGYGDEDGVSQIFRQQVLGGGEFRLSMKIQPAGSSITQAVAADPAGIGCASIFFASKRVRAVPLAGVDGTFYAATPQNVRSLDYPLSRFHFIYVNKPPGRGMSGAAAEFVRFLLSREGQQVVASGGNIALDARAVAEGTRAMR